MIEEKAARSALRDALLGILVALAAGYGFVLVYTLIWARAEIEPTVLLLMPLPVVMLCSWFVLPVGVLTGILLPRFVRGRNGLETLLIAVLVSAAIGVIWMLTSNAFLTRSRGGHDFVVGVAPWLAIYSLPWVLAFAMTRRVRITS